MHRRNFAARSKLDSEKQGSLGKQPISRLKRRFTTVSNWAGRLLAVDLAILAALVFACSSQLP